VIADDHLHIRTGVRMALEDAGMDVVADVGTAADAVAAVQRLQPDVVLLDIHMPGNGLDAARTISATVPDTAVVMLTVSRDDGDLFEALSAGARGYLLKDIDPERLPLALEGVLAGEAALPRSLAARLIEEFRRRESSVAKRTSGVLAALTDREWEVLSLMSDGHATHEISRRLFVSPVTVRTHVSAILRKLHVDSREEAVRLATER
jgi:DNA-binding NarL/FixJ family response regulator